MIVYIAHWKWLLRHVDVLGDTPAPPLEPLSPIYPNHHVVWTALCTYHYPHDRSHHHRLIRTNVCGQRVNLVDPSSVSHRPHNHNHSLGLLNHRMPTASVCPPTLGKIDAKNWVPFEKSKCQHRNLPTWHLINVKLPCKSSLIFSQKF